MLCPICYTRSESVAPIEHLEKTVGDVSSHRMCASCRLAWKQNVCPFCMEVTTAAELVGFITEFIQTVSASASDANASAAVLETVQLFEMEHEGQPAVIKRVYRMIAEDASLASRIDLALQTKKGDWLRDMAGVFWRLHAAAEAGELRGLKPADRARLRRVVEAIWKPFDHQPHELDPHYYGALYTQALVAWLCAWRSGMATAGLVANVQRCGNVLVKWKGATKQHKHDWRRVRDRLHDEYIMLSHEPIWGSRELDPVWKTFCSR